MSKEKRRVPKLRFPGFTEDWEQRKLESILIEYIEKNPGNENLPVLTSSRQGLTKQEDHFGSVQRHDISDYNVIPLGFCTYRNRSDDKTFTFNINRIVPRGLVSKFYPVFEIKNGNADFITEYLNNNTEIIKSLATNAVGTSQVVLSLRTLRNIEITLPLKEEQVAIGDLMRKLDIYITLHQRKLDNLKLKKKALLQKLFPKNGERYPELRFPGFTDAWEQRKLLTVLNKIVDYRGRTPKKLGLDWSPTGHLALSALNVKMGYVDKTVDAHYGDDHLYSVWMKDNDLYKGQVLFTTEAPMGNVAQVPDDNKYILSQRTIAFVPDRRVISDNFLAVVLSASKCQKSLINRASGGTAKGVSQKTLSEISLDIPQSLSEQDKVSELIKKLSKIITLHQRKLDHLQLQKKALLQQMFV